MSLNVQENTLDADI